MAQPIPVAQGKTVGQPVSSDTDYRPGTWKHQLCSCCDMPMLCCNAWWCSPCVLAQSLAKINKYVFVKDFKSFLKLCIGLFTTIVVLQIVYQIIYNVMLGDYVTAVASGDGTKASSTLTSMTTVQNIFSIPLVILGLAYFIIICQTRQQVREARGVNGSPLEDCCCSYFCTVCSMVQVAREVDVDEQCMNMKDTSGGAITGLEKV